MLGELLGTEECRKGWGERRLSEILDVELTHGIPSVQATAKFSPTNHLAHHMEELGHKNFVFNGLRR